MWFICYLFFKYIVLDWISDKLAVKKTQVLICITCAVFFVISRFTLCIYFGISVSSVPLNFAHHTSFYQSCTIMHWWQNFTYFLNAFSMRLSSTSLSCMSTSTSQRWICSIFLLYPKQQPEINASWQKLFVPQFCIRRTKPERRKIHTNLLAMQTYFNGMAIPMNS